MRHLPAGRFPLLLLLRGASARTRRMENDLSPTILSRIEMPISVGRLFQGDLVRNNPGRLCSAIMDQVPEVSIVCLHIGLASPHVLAFGQKRAKIEDNFALPGQLVLGTRVFFDEHADHAYAAGGLH